MTPRLERALAQLPDLLLSHLQLTLLALFVAVLVSVPLGIVATRKERLKQPMLTIAGIVQTIPALALLAVMVPALSSLGLPGIGFLPALLGLTLYCLLPILWGTVTGLAEVDPAAVDAARGVGMTPMESLRLVELPLAMPVIVAGMRTATVWGVGMATLSTPIGAPSLGQLIFSGLQTRNYTSVLVGCVAAALLSQVLDRLVQALELGFSRRRPWLLRTATAGLVGLAALASGSAMMSTGVVGRAPVVIGGKAFTEQYVLTALLADQVQKAGYEAEVTPSLGSSVVFDALRRGDIDLYVDYSGTIWAMVMKRNHIPDNRSAVLAQVRQYLWKHHRIEVVAALGFENTYALAMREAVAAKLGIRTISDLARQSSKLEIGGDFEFFERPEWRSLQDRYGLKFAQRRAMETALLYQAAEQNKVQVVSAYSTDGRLNAFEMRVLEDDLGVIPPYDAMLLASGRLAEGHRMLLQRLSKLDGTISAAAMRRANDLVDLQKQSPEVAVNALRASPSKSGQ